MFTKCVNINKITSTEVLKNACLRSIQCSSVDLNISETYAPPKKAKVVICGGGVMGASVAYHLAKLGWGPDTVLIEQSR